MAVLWLDENYILCDWNTSRSSVFLCSRHQRCEKMLRYAPAISWECFRARLFSFWHSYGYISLVQKSTGLRHQLFNLLFHSSGEINSSRVMPNYYSQYDKIIFVFSKIIYLLCYKQMAAIILLEKQGYPIFFDPMKYFKILLCIRYLARIISIYSLFSKAVRSSTELSEAKWVKIAVILYLYLQAANVSIFLAKFYTIWCTIISQVFSTLHFFLLN